VGDAAGRAAPEVLYQGEVWGIQERAEEEAMTKSKPIDPMCPLKEVSEGAFTKLFYSMDETDRYFHHHMMVDHHRVAIWNWEEGCWWYSQVISILADAVREGLERMKEMGVTV